MTDVGHGPALLPMEANGRCGSRLCESSKRSAPVYKFQSIFGRFPPLQGWRSEKVRFRCAVFRQFPSFHTGAPGDRQGVSGGAPGEAGAIQPVQVRPR